MVIRVEGTKQGNPVKGRRCDAAVKNLADAGGETITTRVGGIPGL